MTAIAITGLVKVYPGPPALRALDGVDLTVERGEIFGLLGPNGAGKTTTVGACTTRIIPTAGTVTIDGIDVVRQPVQVKRRIGVVTQQNTLDRSCTVAENLFYHCRYFGMGQHEAAERTDALLPMFRLADRRDAMVTTLSGGLTQRVQIARAIAHRPQVLFLDEPTAGLDPQSRLALWELVSELRREGLTVLLTTHYMEEADRLCDRVAIIDHGKVLVIGAPSELKRGIGAETVLEVQLEHPSEDAMARLAQVTGVLGVERAGNGLRLFAGGRDGLLTRVVEAAAPFGLSDLTVTEPTLETVFIRLTGRELRE